MWGGLASKRGAVCPHQVVSLTARNAARIASTSVEVLLGTSLSPRFILLRARTASASFETLERRSSKTSQKHYRDAEKQLDPVPLEGASHEVPAESIAQPQHVSIMA